MRRETNAAAQGHSLVDLGRWVSENLREGRQYVEAAQRSGDSTGP
ncbi:MAG TPA: hypothetical protein VKA20_09745 [Rubrobacter sp.]|nr:hypothetical protein [Rubrobacter sp.]